MVASDRGAEPGEVELHDLHAIDFAVAALLAGDVETGIASEHAGQFAAAVEAEVKRVEWPNAAGVNHLRAALAEVVLRLARSSPASGPSRWSLRIIN